MDKAAGDMVHLFFNPIDKEMVRINMRKITSTLPNTANCFWSSHGCLAFIDPCDCGLYLWDFKNVICRPPIETLPFVVRVIRNDDGSIKKFVYQDFFLALKHDRLTPRSMTGCFDWGFALSSAPSSNNDCISVMIVNGAGKFCNLAFCKPGGTEWTALDAPLRPYKRVIASTKVDKVFYAMGMPGEIEAWNLSDLSSIKWTLIDDRRILSKPKFRRFHYEIYLMESSGDLLLVFTYVTGDIHNYVPIFDVYKLDFSLGTWKHVSCLGDRALFVCKSSHFSLPTCDCPGLKPNSIYLADEYYGCYKVGGFNLDNSNEPYYPFGNLKRFKSSPVWVAPNPYTFAMLHNDSHGNDSI